MQLISKTTFQIIRNILSSKYGKEYADIVLYWDKIVGPKLQGQSYPYKVIYPKNSNNCTLYVNVYDSVTNLELNFQREIITEKIAIYLGYKSIKKVVINLKPTLNNKN
ncbi:DUF721 domain-containing protein [Orientia tsutsugamushi]|uniref:DUF721 domain-containing protein n=1 Tax=Orientia tsutsugamushi (strain Boryong) TaxID=357244 RepID=A5CF19_ORITB|nr:DUF721 domain-containing protein [Orientia tsutsugamushi]CAM80875.1 conserved hypothetical protein [Orientia tsutsugamushi str. Boryong]